MCPFSFDILLWFFPYWFVMETCSVLFNFAGFCKLLWFNFICLVAVIYVPINSPLLQFSPENGHSRSSKVALFWHPLPNLFYLYLWLHYLFDSACYHKVMSIFLYVFFCVGNRYFLCSCCLKLHRNCLLTDPLTISICGLMECMFTCNNLV